MRTGLVKNFGEKKNDPEYIAEVVQRLRCSNGIRDTALKMYSHVARNTSFRGLTPSMRAMTLVNLAAKERNEDIRTKRWVDLCSYNTLLSHSKEFKRVLEKSDEFPNLKYRRLGR